MFQFQIFDAFNARKPDEFNVFRGITKNYYFMGIVGVTVLLQVRLVSHFLLLFIVVFLKDLAWTIKFLAVS